MDISVHPTSKLYDLNSKFTSTTLVQLLTPKHIIQTYVHNVYVLHW